jgi:hypothetical protein
MPRWRSRVKAMIAKPGVPLMEPRSRLIRPRGPCRKHRNRAIFTAPPDALLGVIDDCAARGVKSVLVITASFAESFGKPRRFARIADALGLISRSLH